MARSTRAAISASERQKAKQTQEVDTLNKNAEAGNDWCSPEYWDLPETAIDEAVKGADLVMIGSERRQAAARLNGVLARPADAPLADPRELRPVPPRALDFAGLVRDASSNNPTLALSMAQISTSERNAELMRANRIPDLGIGLGVIQKGTRLTDYEVMFEVNIPWQTDVIRAGVNEAQAMSGAAAARRDAARRLWRLARRPFTGRPP